MNRAELQQLAKERIRDARALLAARRWSAAYYLAGYAVECALKTCVIVYLRSSDEFPDRNFSQQCWTHDLKRLLILAGLKPRLDADAASDPELLKNWNLTGEWDESSRYTRRPKSKAEELYNAITDKKHGVFRWVKKHW